MLAKPMIYRHHHHCLSRSIPHLDVHRVCPSRTILILDSQFTKNISPLRLFLSWMPYHILKKYQMPAAYPILHSFFPSEDKNDVPISPSQLGRIYPFLLKECTHFYKKNVPKLPLNQGLVQAPS